MKTYVALLRGINVGGKNSVKMDNLRKILTGLGLTNISTYIQSGNIVFQSTETNKTTLIEMIEKALLEKIGFSIPVVLRTTEEVLKIKAALPFSVEEQDHIYVTLLSDTPDPCTIEQITTSGISEKFKPVNQEIFLLCPEGYHKTKLDNKFWETKLKTKATTRNWQTICRLSEIANKQ